MKKFNFNSSIFKNTNRFVSSTEEDWSAIRLNSYIRFGDDSAHYTVSKTEKFLYIKDFEVINKKTIVINDDIGINILKGDFTNITYKEFELSTIYNIKSRGQGFKNGERIFLKGGIPSKDPASAKPLVSNLMVIKTNPDSSVAELKIENNGKYIIPPTAPFEYESAGKEIELELGFKIIDSRSILERAVEKIEINNGRSIITLLYPIPDGVTEGKISVNKWQGFLESNYAGENKIESPYHITRDTTPILKLPFLLKNNPYPESVFNHAMQILEKEILELKQQIKNPPLSG